MSLLTTLFLCKKKRISALHSQQIRTNEISDLNVVSCLTNFVLNTVFYFNPYLIKSFVCQGAQLCRATLCAVVQ